MTTTTAPAPDEPSSGYWHALAVTRLSAHPGLKPGDGATPCEKLLWRRLVDLQAAAYGVLSDIDDDGVAEANDMAVLGLRQAVSDAPKAVPVKRDIKAGAGSVRRITTK